MKTINFPAIKLPFTISEQDWTPPQLQSVFEIATQKMMDALPEGHEALEVVRGGSRYYYATNQGLPQYWWDGRKWLPVGKGA